MKKVFAGLCACLLCCFAVAIGACGGNKQPEKLKDGAPVTLLEGETATLDLTEYISVDGTKFNYEVNSSNMDAATVELDGTDAVITAVKKGNAVVTASAGEAYVEFAIEVKEKTVAPIEKDAPVFKDITVEYDLTEQTSKKIKLAPESGESTYVYTYSLKAADEKVTIEGDELTVAYTEVTEKALTVVASYTDTANTAMAAKTVEFKLTVKVIDSTQPDDPAAGYRVKNGDFSNGLSGWTMSGEIGEITEKDTFWAQNYPIGNTGKYFSGENMEGATGTLTSSSFTVGGINKITFKLGAAGNSNCYITLENEDNEILAVWRNIKFEDIGGNCPIEEVGVTKFAVNLATYVADLTEWEGQKLHLVLRDNAKTGFGFITFDELVTYYESEDELPENAFDAINLKTVDKTELNTLIESVPAVQGDYTAASYKALTDKLAEANAIKSSISATQSEVDAVKTALQTAVDGLETRVPVEVANANKTLTVISDGNREINLSDYVNEDGLSKITYDISANNALLTVGGIAGGKATLTAGHTEAEVTVKLTISVKYDGAEKLSVELTVKVVAEQKPVLTEESVTKNVDIWGLTDKTKYVLDFAANVDNPADLALTYTVTDGNGHGVSLDNDNRFEYTFNGTYGEVETVASYTVVVGYGEGKSVSYTYTLNVVDTTAFRIQNGGFETGDLTGWELSNVKIGNVSGVENYWVGDSVQPEGFAFGKDGNYMFSAYAEGATEDAVGTLTSSSFKIGGSGFITYKLGAAKNADKVFIDVIEKDTGLILARFYNNAFSDVAGEQIRGCTLRAYKADLSAHIGKTVYLRVSDNAVRDYGLFFLDSVETYYKTEPTVENTAVAVTRGVPASIYAVSNGDFETGDLTGWELVSGEIPGKVTNLDGYWPENNTYNKDGEYLFTGAEGQSFETDPNLEYRKGIMRSNVFTLRANGWISFKLGGAGNENTYLRIVTATGEVIAKFRNPAIQDCKLIQYVYQFANAEEIECYIEMYDNAERDWGLIVADSFITDYTVAPELDGAITAEDKK